MTTVATGTGAWLGGVVVPDSCPSSATASRALFSADGGSGTFAIEAGPSCSWTIDASAVLGLSLGGPSSGTGNASVPFTLAPSTSAQCAGRSGSVP